ncbi:histidinol-phosphate aminotransferase [Rhizobium sp. RU20A]|uniref:pyridoxal phosphate-dependent aminotransferase n=1 Tax=Rhizobium sp. RU20A TaxID=1907412 RepID=UPI000956AA25|nr:pyridoxal phosphate-dependent aminotransferase [Rhizobium sp. RU20A]SIR14541.1 histidinol-phosphate aminotransferase [Rhizobium sp. RU20A]
MSVFPFLTPLAESLASTVPFVGPEAIERMRGRPVLARIGANESGFGPSPRVIETIAAAAMETWKYADPENFRLKAALGRHLGVAPATIAVGEGIDGLLGQIVRLVIEPGRTVVTSQGGYPTFNYHVTGHGGRLVTVPYTCDDREDLDGLLGAIGREKATLAYLANPDNPMGSWWNADRIIAFARAVPETCLLILDEAYSETAPADTLPDIASLIDQPNVIRTRTFSKAYGLAGARVGYTISTPENAVLFDKIRNHFGMNRIAVEAAITALGDQTYLAEALSKIAASRTEIARIAQEAGLKPLPSATNFVAVDCGRDGAFARAIVDRLMAEHGIFIRMPGVAPLNRCIRISTGPEAEMGLLAGALGDVVEAVGRQ